MPTACSSVVHAGLGSYEPQHGFSFPRSYIHKWSTGLFTWTAHFNDNLIHFTHNTLAGYHAYILMKPEVWDWSSNNYSLDHVICGAWYDFAGSTFGMNYRVKWLPSDDGFLASLYVHALDTPEGGPAENPLPGPPGDYWLPFGA